MLVVLLADLGPDSGRNIPKGIITILTIASGLVLITMAKLGIRDASTTTIAKDIDKEYPQKRKVPGKT